MKWFYADNWFFGNEMADSEVSAFYLPLWKATFHWICSDKLITNLEEHSKLSSAVWILSSELKDNQINVFCYDFIVNSKLRSVCFFRILILWAGDTILVINIVKGGVMVLWEIPWAKKNMGQYKSWN